LLLLLLPRWSRLDSGAQRPRGAGSHANAPSAPSLLLCHEARRLKSCRRCSASWTQARERVATRAGARRGLGRSDRAAPVNRSRALPRAPAPPPRPQVRTTTAVAATAATGGGRCCLGASWYSGFKAD
jgi:hypothetical protein